MKKVAIFASGNGSNAENIIKYFIRSSSIKINLIVTNNPNAKVLERIKNYNITTKVFSKQDLESGKVLNALQLHKINFIVLAGFLLKIPEEMIANYDKKIINIHPSLLPLYGGKGMYGRHIHKKVFESKDDKTGITIHFVNKNYDEGDIIFQAKCQLPKNVTLKGIQKKVHKLELNFFPRIIESLLNGDN